MKPKTSVDSYTSDFFSDLSDETKASDCSNSRSRSDSFMSLKSGHFAEINSTISKEDSESEDDLSSDEETNLFSLITNLV